MESSKGDGAPNHIAAEGFESLGIGGVAKPLDPQSQPARLRAFFVDPAHARKGIGRMLLAQCELEAHVAHFRTLELMESARRAHSDAADV